MGGAGGEVWDLGFGDVCLGCWMLESVCVGWIPLSCFVFGGDFLVGGNCGWC